ncbi:hypothetical protein V5E97_30830 [Singulisphaera sp. Ch08]|uniref:Uncharacterized protein n=1 Tax=Singulisphaera sp. Ch08 TaxID=3120278 RepID=A0AAU7CDA0_9BACT
MGKAMTGWWITVFAFGLVSGPELCAQSVEGLGATAQGDALRGQGRFMRGMAWYELGAAQAQAIEAEAVFAWNRSVQADYEQYLAGRARRAAAKKALSNEREEQATKRFEALRLRWREKPTVEDVRSGVALNALASDLADPKIPLARWRLAPVDLPPEVTIETLAFRFADAPKSQAPSGLVSGTVAIGRMKGERWPVSLRRADLVKEREAYRTAVAGVIAACRAEKPLQAPQVDAIRDRLFALKDKAASTVPTDAGLRKQAIAYLNRLDEATKVFLDRDFAEELVRDVERHKARTVGELLGFMKKYRLLFDEGDENPETWAVYQTLYDLLKRQKASLDFEDEAGAGEDSCGHCQALERTLP